jgi:hypothetical protein
LNKLLLDKSKTIESLQRQFDLVSVATKKFHHNPFREESVEVSSGLYSRVGGERSNVDLKASNYHASLEQLRGNLFFLLMNKWKLSLLLIQCILFVVLESYTPTVTVNASHFDTIVQRLSQDREREKKHPILHRLIESKDDTADPRAGTEFHYHHKMKFDLVEARKRPELSDGSALLQQFFSEKACFGAELEQERYALALEELKTQRFQLEEQRLLQERLSLQREKDRLSLEKEKPGSEQTAVLEIVKNSLVSKVAVAAPNIAANDPEVDDDYSIAQKALPTLRETISNTFDLEKSSNVFQGTGSLSLDCDDDCKSKDESDSGKAIDKISPTVLNCHDQNQNPPDEKEENVASRSVELNCHDQNQNPQDKKEENVASRSVETDAFPDAKTITADDGLMLQQLEPAAKVKLHNGLTSNLSQISHKSTPLLDTVAVLNTVSAEPFFKAKSSGRDDLNDNNIVSVRSSEHAGTSVIEDSVPAAAAAAAGTEDLPAAAGTGNQPAAGTENQLAANGPEDQPAAASFKDQPVAAGTEDQQKKEEEDEILAARARVLARRQKQKMLQNHSSALLSSSLPNSIQSMVPGKQDYYNQSEISRNTESSNEVSNAISHDQSTISTMLLPVGGHVGVSTSVDSGLTFGARNSKAQHTVGLESRRLFENPTFQSLHDVSF